LRVALGGAGIAREIFGSKMLEEFTRQPPHFYRGKNTKKLRIFESIQKIQKASKMTIIGSVITNLSLLFSLLVVVVSKLGFGWLNVVGGWPVNSSAQRVDLLRSGEEFDNLRSPRQQHRVPPSSNSQATSYPTA
jgi:hypothetical protein